MKRLLLAALFAAPCINAMEMINPSAVSSAQQLKLYANEKHLFVEDENAAYRVERHDMNPLLREVMHRQAMGKFIGDGYIRVNKLEEGKYALDANVRVLGGGGGGAAAGVIIGKGLTYGVCYGGIWVASLIAGPASTPTAMIVGKTASPFIELLSNKVAIGCGILGGILTGPV